MDQHLLTDVKDWVGYTRTPKAIEHRRTPERVMKLLHIANDPHETQKVIPPTYRKDQQAHENCRKFLKIFAVGLAYAHYSTEGFSAEIDFPARINWNGKWVRDAAFYRRDFNRIIATQWFMFKTYNEFDTDIQTIRSRNEAILGLPYGTDERFCLMAGVEEGLHAALALERVMHLTKESTPIDYETFRFGVDVPPMHSKERYKKSHAERQIQEWLPKIWRDFGLDRQYGIEFTPDGLKHAAQKQSRWR